jgi:hypothetical protein
MTNYIPGFEQINAYGKYDIITIVANVDRRVNSITKYYKAGIAQPSALGSEPAHNT